MQSLLLTGDVITMDPARPRVRAVGIRGDRIVALGSVAEVRRELRGRVVEHDPGGWVLPGFVDSHVHVLWAGRAEERVGLDDATSIAEIGRRLAAHAARNPGDGWIEAEAGFDPGDLTDGRMPTAADLDAAVGDRPVILDRKGHDAIVNTAGLRAARVDASTPDPPGGRIDRAPDGRPTGLLVEHPAADLARSVIPEPDRARRVGWISAGTRRLRGHGFTSAMDPAVGPADLVAYADAARSGRLATRTVVMPLGDDHLDDATLQEAVRGAGVADAAPDRLRVGPTKLFLDGGGSLGTAWRSTPWPCTDGYTGNRTLSVEALRAHCAAAAAAGRGVGVHAVGDAAVDLVLDVLEEIDRRTPVAGLGFHLIHAYLEPGARAMRRTRRLGVAVSAHPALWWSAGATIAERLGPDVAARSNPLRSWIDAGVLVGGGSDGPGPPLAALHGMWQSRTREVRGLTGPVGPDEAVTAEEALALFTTRAAAVAGLDGPGRLRVGGPADVAVTDVDPLGPAGPLRDGRVLATVVAGELHTP
ncbi:amidohydrolase family protein [Pseudonocardia nematodicida]|uniref:Amidohydrolase family protein n=1 Tax=Pseudonocardia nematodicida TaxID=1206997 RepID=A0ABV1K3H1_9PSEU